MLRETCTGTYGLRFVNTQSQIRVDPTWYLAVYWPFLLRTDMPQEPYSPTLSRAGGTKLHWPGAQRKAPLVFNKAHHYPLASLPRLEDRTICLK